MPTKRINLEQETNMHFLTITTIEWIDIFTKMEYFQIICDSLNFCQLLKGLKIFEYVIMPNHLHLITRSINKLSQNISDFKRHTTNEILKLLKQDNRKYILKLLNNSFKRKRSTKIQLWQREN